MEEEWLKFKRYPHIGRPLIKRSDSSWVKSYVSDPDKIANHKFVPLLHRTLTQRKYRPKKDAPKVKGGKRQRSVANPKERHIYFPSHLDSIVYGFYNHILTAAYEEYLKGKEYGSVAVAYRKVPKGNGERGNKCNIEFAFEAIDFIEKNKGRKLSIIISDVTSFFDNLNHRKLHTQWKKVLNVTDLPKDQYVVYKSLVSKKYVEENQLFSRFKSKLIVERFKPHDTSKKELKRKHVSKIYNLKKENVVAFCETNEFFNEASDLIKVDKPYKNSLRGIIGKQELKGIPQGTPISATLANVYMLDFDERIYNATQEVSRNAYYQRYSDDLIIVCDQQDEDYFYRLIQQEIEEKALLEIQRSKTNIYRYEFNEKKEFLGGIYEDNQVSLNKQLEYLGFVYDGSKVRVKTAGFSKFYRNMERSFKRGEYFAKKAHIPAEGLFETRLYKRFTHLGSKRRLKWLPDASSPNGYKRTTQTDWGNFISYLNKANNVMKEINGDDTIVKQYSKVWSHFHRIKEKTYKRLGKKGKSNKKNVPE